MGTTGSSSKRKSIRRKSSKKSYQARRKKKSGRNKSKRLRRRNDSASSYSDDRSKSLTSVSSSSSEDDYSSSSEDEYKSRKGRSRARSDVKSRRKKTRRRSSSQESSEDSVSPKKRKKLKKDVNFRSRKKSRKTKRKRHVSISPASSDSQSRSTFQGEESESEGRMGRSRNNKKIKRGPKRTKRRYSKSRSPSCSSSSRYSHQNRSGSPGEETIPKENKSFRLRSIIVRKDHELDSNKSEKDPYKEEIVYDHDDYPSSRSNDSNDGASKRESANYSRVAFDEKRQGENLTREEVTLSEPIIEEPAEDDFNHGGTNAGDSGIDSLKTNSPAKENETSSKVSDPQGDLELLLRQKALENLRRFRGERQMKLTTATDKEIRNNTRDSRVSSAKGEDAHQEPLKLCGASDHYPATNVVMNCNPLLNKEFRPFAGKIEGDPRMSKHNDIRQPPSENSKQKKTTRCAVNEKSGVEISALNKGALGTGTVLKPETKLQAPPASCTEIAPTVSPSLTLCSDNNLDRCGVVDVTSSSTGKELNNSHAESIDVPAGEQSSKERQNVSKDSSEFKQKTMSVMRGGEMVQVSYKVYIPKKAPALARRQLKR